MEPNHQRKLNKSYKNGKKKSDHKSVKRETHTHLELKRSWFESMDSSPPSLFLFFFFQPSPCCFLSCLSLSWSGSQYHRSVPGFRRFWVSWRVREGITYREASPLPPLGAVSGLLGLVVVGLYFFVGDGVIDALTAGSSSSSSSLKWLLWQLNFKTK